MMRGLLLGILLIFTICSYGYAEQVIVIQDLPSHRNKVFTDELTAALQEQKVQVKTCTSLGKQANIEDIIKDINGEKTIIIPIGKQPTNAVSKATKEIPILSVFVEQYKPSDASGELQPNLYHAALRKPYREVLECLKKRHPSASKLGLLYTDKVEENQAEADEIKKNAEQLGITVTESKLDYGFCRTDDEIKDALGKLEGIDCFYFVHDGNTRKFETVIYRALQERKIPAIGDEDALKRGFCDIAVCLDIKEYAGFVSERVAPLLRHEDTGRREAFTYTIKINEQSTNGKSANAR